MLLTLVSLISGMMQSYIVHVGQQMEERPKNLRSRVKSLNRAKRYASLNAALVVSKEREKAASQSAATDPMTGLPNRAGLERAVCGFKKDICEARSVRTHRRAGDHSNERGSGETDYVVVVVDLDHFKQINDTMGHDTGDMAIKQAAKIMRQALRRKDIVARTGGDEFVIVLPIQVETAHQSRLNSLDVAADIAEKKIRRAISENPLILDDGTVIPLSSSVGLAMVGEDGDFDKAMIKADHACYVSKGKPDFKGKPITSRGVPKNRVAIALDSGSEPMLWQEYKAARSATVFLDAGMPADLPPSVSREDIRGLTFQKTGLTLTRS